MSNRFEAITGYLNKGIIEASMEYAKKEESPLSLVKFGFEVDLEDGYFFKNLVSFLHANSGFNSLLNMGNDTFILLLRDTKIHGAKTLIKKMELGIKQTFKTEIKAIGMTLFDANDTYKSLMDRLDKYFVMSKLSSRKKIFYGTLDFDFYETHDHRNDVLTKILKKYPKVTLHNLFNGVPIKEDVEMVKFEEGIAQAHIPTLKIHFYSKEEFTFIQHERIPNTIKARILKADPVKSLLILKDLEFLDASPVERGDIRVQPERRISVTLLNDKIKLLDGTIANISEGSVALNAKINDLEKLLKKDCLEKELDLEFQLPTEKSFLTRINVKATIFSIINEMVVLNIKPSVFMKSKIRQYVALRQNGLLVDLKQYLKGVI